MSFMVGPVHLALAGISVFLWRRSKARDAALNFHLLFFRS